MPTIIRMIKLRRMKWVGHVARMWEKRKAYWLLVGKPEGNRPLVRQKPWWVDNINKDLRDIGWGVSIAWVWLRIGTSGELL
jgi:hypothetical protein